MAIDKQPSCDDVIEPELLPVEIALQRIAQQVQPLSAGGADNSEQLGLRESLGRIVAQDILSPINVPAYTNSAMDGYAVNGADIPGVDDSTERDLVVLGTAWAGRPLDVTVESGQAVRIMTGGMMPQGSDTVVIQEHVQATESDGEVSAITIDNTTSVGRNVRIAGEDIKTGGLFRPVVCQRVRRILSVRPWQSWERSHSGNWRCVPAARLPAVKSATLTFLACRVIPWR